MNTIKANYRSFKGKLHLEGRCLARRALALIFALAAIIISVPCQAIPTFGNRVAVYVDEGACGDNLLALFRALQSTGFDPAGITAGSIAEGCLTKDYFDVFVLPAGENGSPLGYAKHFADVNKLYNAPRAIEKNILNFVFNGGGIVGIESGAYYSSVLFDFVKYNKSYPIPGVRDFVIYPNQLGIKVGPQAVYNCSGGGFFSNVNMMTTSVIAVDPQNIQPNQAMLISSMYGKGHIILCAFNPELRWDSDLDWTAWDKWDYGTSHPNSEGAWKLLGSMVNSAANNVRYSSDVIAANPKGARVALVTTHNYAGGAGAALLPAFARSIEYAGHIPLAIRCSDIQKGYLKNQDFEVVAFPGGTAGGYVKDLKGHESKVLDFIRNGGSFYGVCAGSYYASSIMMWDGGSAYKGELLSLFKGTDTGPLAEICPWPYYKMTPVKINDPVIGDLGIIKILYYGGGHKSREEGVDVVATYVDSSSGDEVDGIRFTYGSGRVFLSGTHPEINPYADDWLFWDKFYMSASGKPEKIQNAYQANAKGHAAKGVTQESKEEEMGTSWYYEKCIFNNWLVR